jgi:hypothetical protein
MRGLDPRIHRKNTFFAQMDGLYRNSGLPEFRVILCRRSGKPDLRCQARQRRAYRCMPMRIGIIQRGSDLNRRVRQRKTSSLHREWVSRPSCAACHAATPAMIDDSQLSFSLPSDSRRKITAVFDGGRLSSDSDMTLPTLVECRRNVAATRAALIADRRDPSHIRHAVADVLRTRWRVRWAVVCS